MNYISRTLEGKLREAGGKYPLLLLSGPRGAGKTTLLQKLASEDRAYVSLSDEGARKLAKKDPDRFFEMHKPPLFIDDAEEVPSLFLTLPLSSARPGDYWLAYSGRLPEKVYFEENQAALFELAPLSMMEIDGISLAPFEFSLKKLEMAETLAPRRSDRDIFREIWTGFMPAVRGGMDRAAFYAGYVSSLIETDVKKHVRLRSSRKFLDFLMVLAADDDQSLNYEGLAREADINPVTARKWVHLLESLGVIYFLPAYTHPSLKKAIRTSKLYFADTGLVCYLRNRNSPVAAMTGGLREALYNNYIISEIRKSYIHQGIRKQLYYYREANKREIPLLFEEGGFLHPVDFSLSSHPTLPTMADFSMLDDSGISRNPGGTIAMIREPKLFKNGSRAVPVSFLG